MNEIIPADSLKHALTPRLLHHRHTTHFTAWWSERATAQSTSSQHVLHASSARWKPREQEAEECVLRRNWGTACFSMSLIPITLPQWDCHMCCNAYWEKFTANQVKHEQMCFLGSLKHKRSLNIISTKKQNTVNWSIFYENYSDEPTLADLVMFYIWNVFCLYQIQLVLN